jgi:hypothetical protein
MKNKIFLSISFAAAAFLLALLPSALASTAGNTAGVNPLNGKGIFSLRETRNIPVEGGFDVDVILDRDFDAGDVTNARFQTSEWSMARIGCRVVDRLEPYVRLGWAHLKVEWKDSASGTKVAMSSKSDFAWGVGVKALIYEFKRSRIKISVDGCYRTADLDAENGYFDDNKTAINTKESRFVIREWQAALLASGEIDLGAKLSEIEALRDYKLCPYGGLICSAISGRLRLVRSDTGEIYHPHNIKADKSVGIVAGFDVVAPDNSTAFNFEGRFVSETALSGGLSLLF